MVRVSRGFQVSCVALLSGAAAYAVALAWLPSCLVDGQYLPMGPDSFYHARRILDAMAGSFYQFDPRMHVPEGSWITWPWAYDLLLAWLTLGLQKISGAADPMAILVHVPPTWAFVNATLLLALGATLGLRLLLLLLLGAAFAFSPLTQVLHGVGVLDHHYVEYSFVLLTLLAGVRWLQAPDDGRRAALLGVALGVAPAFHNGLFALQIPVDAALFLLWLKGQQPPARSLRAFAAALVLATLAAVLPSEPFRLGHFAFATLSWFHLYVAALSAAAAAVLSWRPCSRAALAILAALGLVAVLPLWRELQGGSQFLAGTLVQIDQMLEMASLAQQWRRDGPAGVLALYTGLILLLPFIAALCAFVAWRRTSPPHEQFLAVYGLFGIALLCLQLRLHYFGSAVLYLAPLLVLQRAGTRTMALGAAALIAAWVPAFAGLWEPGPIALSYEYTYTRGLYPKLRAACAEHPGTVLADAEDGHYIRYHTECSVISNNFIMTPQTERKLLETEALLRLSARELLAQRPDIDYVLLVRNDPFAQELAPEAVAALNAGLRNELLLGDGPFPAPFQPLFQVTLETSPQRTIVAGRLFRIVR